MSDHRRWLSQIVSNFDMMGSPTAHLEAVHVRQRTLQLILFWQLIANNRTLLFESIGWLKHPNLHSVHCNASVCAVVNRLRREAFQMKLCLRLLSSHLWGEGNDAKAWSNVQKTFNRIHEFVDCPEPVLLKPTLRFVSYWDDITIK
eukprot:COSAG06_NODE_32425_length_506_cov_1.017199_1_plen_145_part_01